VLNSVNNEVDEVGKSGNASQYNGTYILYVKEVDPLTNRILSYNLWMMSPPQLRIFIFH